jgi:putative FmdB family regulatory protein
VATYQYQCPDHGLLDVMMPIGTAPPTVQCRNCDTDAVRIFSAPMLSLAPRALIAAMDRADKSRDEPDVVTSLPRHAPRRPHPALANPALRKLPRP